MEEKAGGRVVGAGESGRAGVCERAPPGELAPKKMVGRSNPPAPAGNGEMICSTGIPEAGAGYCRL